MNLDKYCVSCKLRFLKPDRSSSDRVSFKRFCFFLRLRLELPTHSQKSSLRFPSRYCIGIRLPFCLFSEDITRTLLLYVSSKLSEYGIIWSISVYPTSKRFSILIGFKEYGQIPSCSSHSFSFIKSCPVGLRRPNSFLKRSIIRSLRAWFSFCPFSILLRSALFLLSSRASSILTKQGLSPISRIIAFTTLIVCETARRTTGFVISPSSGASFSCAGRYIRLSVSSALKL